MDYSDLEFDEEKYYLGTLCMRGHDWNNTGASLRYNSGPCIECGKVRNLEWEREYYKKNREKINRQRRDRLKNNLSTKWNKQMADSRFYQKNKERLRKYKAEWAKKDRAKRKYKKNCKYCGEEFNATRKNVKYCAMSCYYAERKEKADAKKTPVEHDEGDIIAYLGNLCARGHDYNNTGKSLRSISKSDCLFCKKERRPEERKRFLERKGHIVNIIDYQLAKLNSGEYCGCGCGRTVYPGNTYVSGHQSRVLHPMKGRIGKDSPGYIHGLLCESIHGEHANRKYQRRWSLKKRHWKEVIEIINSDRASDVAVVIGMEAIDKFTNLWTRLNELKRKKEWKEWIMALQDYVDISEEATIALLQGTNTRPQFVVKSAIRQAEVHVKTLQEQSNRVAINAFNHPDQVVPLLDT
jgi:hypothetical protein